jgi:hypothetical protein
LDFGRQTENQAFNWREQAFALNKNSIGPPRRVPDGLSASRSNFDVAQAHAYQMYGYARVYRSRATILLYPHRQSIVGESGLQAVWRFEFGDAALIIATIDVAKPDGFAASLRCLLVSPLEG